MAQVDQLSLRRALSSEPYAALRTLLIDARKSAGLTQQELADRVGRQQSFVAKYEVGERSVDAVELIGLAAILRIDLGQLSATIYEQLSGR